MKLFVQGVGEVVLSKGKFVHQGGEGSVFRIGNTAYKIYADPKKMIPLGKIQELSSLDASNIVRPQDILLDAKNSSVGYTMPFVADAFSLCQLFPRAFRRRNNVSPDKIAQLVLRMRKTVAYIHGKHILLVDLNELNFLVDHQFRDVYFIDTDSYQTPHFPATALMSSVKDWHAKKFSELSDWFSFGVVTFQMFAGIHPYRGKHPVYGDNFEDRMKRNISVFDAAVRLPPACEPFDVIPEIWRDWYCAIFSGARISPPEGMIAATSIKKPTRVLAKSGKLEFQLMEQFPSDILGVFSSAGVAVVQTEDGVYTGGKRHASYEVFSHITFTPKMNRPICARLHGGVDVQRENRWNVELYDVLKDSPLPLVAPLLARDLMEYDGRLYLQYGGHVQEIQFIPTGGGYLTPAKEVARVLDHSCQVFPGVIIQDLLSGEDGHRRRHNALIFPARGTCYQIPLPELDACRVIDAKFDGGVLMAVGEQNGRYDRFVFRFVAKYDVQHEDRYECWCIPGVANYGLNFVVLDSGVCVCYNEEGKLEVFRNIKGDTHRTTIEDDNLQNGLQLFKNGGQLLATQGNKLYRLSVINS